MPLDRGILIVEGTANAVSLPHTTTGVVLIAPANTGGEAAEGEIIKIQNSADARKFFGTPTTAENEVNVYLDILQRYGVGSILAAKAADPTTIINKLPSAFSDYGINPDLIVVPTLPAAAVEGALKIAESLGSVILTDYARDKNVDGIVTERGTDAGINMKNSRLIPCFGYTQSKLNPDWYEALSVHLAGIIAKYDSEMHQGISPSNKLLMGVDQIAIKKAGAADPLGGGGGEDTPLLTTSFGDETSSSEKLNDVGVITLNRRDDGLVTWGDRNGLYPKDLGFLSIISVVRVKDAILKISQKRASHFLDLQSTKRTGQTLETSLEDGLAKAANQGLITNTYSVQFLESESDYTNGKLVVCLEFTPYTSVRLIELKPVFKLTITV